MLDYRKEKNELLARIGALKTANSVMHQALLKAQSCLQGHVQAESLAAKKHLDVVTQAIAVSEASSSMENSLDNFQYVEQRLRDED